MHIKVIEKCLGIRAFMIFDFLKSFLRSKCYTSGVLD
jgi:hypothetical protein